jgi:hypothetical protein
VLERKVWADLDKPIYPNLYIFLVGKAAAGKTRAIDSMMEILRAIPEFYFSPTSVTRASLVDCMLDAKRTDPDWSAGTMSEYHTLYVAVDELSAFMETWKEDLVAGLTKFYDGNHYSESRRTGNLHIEIDKPNLSVICGTTPANLMGLIPDKAWDQGFTSRIILVWSDDSKERDVLSKSEIDVPAGDLAHDICVIHREARGPVTWTAEYHMAMKVWRSLEDSDGPMHPRLTDYRARRRTHLIKLSIISCIDRGSVVMGIEDFNRAKEWLVDNELNMHIIFSSAATTIDDKAFDEIEEFVKNFGKPVPHHKVLRHVSRFIPAHSQERVIRLLIEQRRIKIAGRDEKINQVVYLPQDK